MARTPNRATAARRLDLRSKNAVLSVGLIFMRVLGGMRLRIVSGVPRSPGFSHNFPDFFRRAATHARNPNLHVDRSRSGRVRRRLEIENAHGGENTGDQGFRRHSRTE